MQALPRNIFYNINNSLQVTTIKAKESHTDQGLLGIKQCKITSTLEMSQICLDVGPVDQVSHFPVYLKSLTTLVSEGDLGERILISLM